METLNNDDDDEEEEETKYRNEYIYIHIYDLFSLFWPWPNILNIFIHAIDTPKYLLRRSH